MISKIHPILLIDPPHREASVKGRDARIAVGTQASGSCLRYGLEVRLHTDTASSHKSLLCGGEKKKNMPLVYSATFSLCLLSVLFLPSLPSPHTIHVQLCRHGYASWWGLLTIPTTPASRKRGEGAGQTTPHCPRDPGHYQLPVARARWWNWEKQPRHWGEKTRDRHVFSSCCIHQLVSKRGKSQTQKRRGVPGKKRAEALRRFKKSGIFRTDLVLPAWV